MKLWVVNLLAPSQIRKRAHMKRLIRPSAYCLQFVALCLLTLCLCTPANADEEAALPPGKVPEELYWIADDGGAMDQEEFEGVTINSIFRGSRSEPKVVMFYPSVGQEKIDAAVKELITASIDVFYRTIEKEKNETTDNSQTDYSKYILSSNYKVTFPTSKVVAIEFSFGVKYGWRSFRHSQNIAFYSKTGEFIEFKNLFDKPQVALKILSDWSKATLPKKLPIVNMHDITSGTSPKEDNFNNYRIAPKGLFIQFGRYQVGPGAVGSPEIFIPLKKLEGAGPSTSVWDKPDLHKIALSLPLATPLRPSSLVKKEHATFLIPTEDVIQLPCKEGDEYNERCLFICPDFTLHVDQKSDEFAFVEGPMGNGGVAYLGYVWGIYETELGYKSTNPMLIGDRYDYKSVHIKGNTILFTGVKTSHYSQDRTNLKFSIVNGVLKKVN